MERHHFLLIVKNKQKSGIFAAFSYVLCVTYVLYQAYYHVLVCQTYVLYVTYYRVFSIFKGTQRYAVPLFRLYTHNVIIGGFYAYFTVFLRGLRIPFARNSKTAIQFSPFIVRITPHLI